jgi:hypothetical protein
MALLAAIGVGFLVVSVGIVLLAAATNQRIYDLLTVNLVEIFQSERLPVIYNLANHLEYAERLLYWISSFLVFSKYPLLGVGLGNMGFFFPKVVPAFGTYLPEILQILGPVQVKLANPKSLWLRLLAETGILGLSAFLTWLLAHALMAGRLLRSERGLLGSVGLAAGIALIAQVFEGFSLDTFALPQLWLILGFGVAAWSSASRSVMEA